MPLAANKSLISSTVFQTDDLETGGMVSHCPILHTQHLLPQLWHSHSQNRSFTSRKIKEGKDLFERSPIIRCHYSAHALFFAISLLTFTHRSEKTWPKRSLACASFLSVYVCTLTVYWYTYMVSTLPSHSYPVAASPLHCSGIHQILRSLQIPAGCSHC